MTLRTPIHHSGFRKAAEELEGPLNEQKRFVGHKNLGGHGPGAACGMVHSPLVTMGGLTLGNVTPGPKRFAFAGISYCIRRFRKPG
jgi:hypothetical protein